MVTPATFNGKDVEAFELPADLNMRDDMLEADKLVRPVGKSALEMMCGNCHRFTVKGESASSNFSTTMSCFHVVLMNTEVPGNPGKRMCDFLNDSDCKDVTLVDKTPNGTDDGSWACEITESGQKVIGVSGIKKHMKDEWEKRQNDRGTISKVVVSLIVIACIFLFKLNHHYLPDEIGKLIQLIEGCGAGTMLTALGIKYTDGKYLQKLTRTLLHPLKMEVKWQIAVVKGTEKIYSCRLTGMGSGNAKMGVIIGLYLHAMKDSTLSCFLANTWTVEMIQNVKKIYNQSSQIDEAVKFCTNSSALSGHSFIDTKNIYEVFDVAIVVGCVNYVGGSLADQKTYSDSDYSVAKARVITEKMKKLCSVINGKIAGDPIAVLETLIKSADERAEAAVTVPVDISKTIQGVIGTDVP